MRATPARLAVLGVCAIAAAVGLAGCSPTENTGLEIDAQAVSCYVDAGSGAAVLQIPVAADPSLEFIPDIHRVEFDEPRGIALAGIDLVVEGTPYGAANPVPPAELATMTAARDNGMLYLSLPPSGPATLVLLVEVEGANGAGAFDSFRVFWGGGEPLYWQTVDVAARVTDTCDLTA